MIYCEHWPNTFLSVEILGIKAKNLKILTFILLIFAYYGRLLGIGNVTSIVNDLESLPRFLSFNRLSLHLLKLPQSNLKVVWGHHWRGGNRGVKAYEA